MSRFIRLDYDHIHDYVDRVEDVLLSESSWSTSDSDCSGCLHLSKESIQEEGISSADSSALPAVIDNNVEQLTERTPLVKKGNRQESESNFQISSARASTNVQSLNLEGRSKQRKQFFGNISDVFASSGIQHKCAQPWHNNICAAQGRYFAYAATLVIYVYETVENGSEWQLCSVLADHRKTITAIAWHPRHCDLLASSSEDQRVCVWSVSQQRVLCAISLCRTPCLVAWCSLTQHSTSSGPIQLWEGSENSEPLPFRESHPYSRELRLYRWHRTIPGRLAVALGDAKITLYRENGGQVKSNWCPEACGESGCGELPTGEIIGMEWAECSPDYLLVSYSCGRLWLVDTVALLVVTTFDVPATVSVASIAWLPNAPGLFVTGDGGKGVLRVWTVSKPTPLQSLTLKDTGFHELCVTRFQTSSFSTQDLSCTAGAVLPSVPILCLFKDGGVGLYHIRRRHWIFHREHGHTETIFDCDFKPEDCDQLATGSFDGSIKVWRVDTLDAVATLPNCRSIIYSVSWAPADLCCVAASTNNGRVFIWDVARQKIIRELTGHKKTKVFCVSWNQIDSRRVASVGESCICFVHQVDGHQVQAYQHPEPVYGCDWQGADTLATGCHDGRIRVFNVVSSRSEPTVVLKAHSKRVFRVKWNPVYEDVLCSGSDDCSVRLWSVSRAQCLAVLHGHTDNVRGLAWCPGLPCLLVSGSWDRTIRVWHAQQARCLDIVSEHGADIYGLSIHPLRPFLVASCSRDSTVRLWSLASFASPLFLRILASRPLSEIIRSSDEASETLSSLLCGIRAKHLIASQDNKPSLPANAATVKLAADVFTVDVHTRNLWDLCSVVCGHGSVSSLSPQYPNSIVHHSHLTKCNLAAAERELQSRAGQQRSLVDLARGSWQHSDAFEVVAAKYLRCGALRQYCDLMMRKGCWDHALALAPAVSLDYWRELLNKYGQSLASEDNEQCVPYMMAAKNLDGLLHFRIARGSRY